MVYDLHMANLSRNTDLGTVPEGPTKLHLALIDAMEKGMTVSEISKKLAPGDKAKQKSWRTRIRTMLQKDPILAQAIVGRAQSNLLMAVPGTTVAVGKRAQRGRMDAARTVLEATGVHNPRVKHEHSGDIKITLDMPRPKFIDAEAIEDVEVVEEG